MKVKKIKVDGRKKSKKVWQMKEEEERVNAESTFSFYLKINDEQRMSSLKNVSIINILNTTLTLKTFNIFTY